MADLDRTKQRLCDEVDRWADDLLAASHEIHANPELCFNEHHAADVLCDLLERAGLTPERGAAGMETAFVARAGDAGPTVAVLCEYDALPEIGHACGHNIIGTAGLGAGLAAAALAAELGGRVRILGTPAEEGGGGKVPFVESGTFDDVAAALMVHPASADLSRMNAIAIQQAHVTYHGKAAHAAAAPWAGRNALDAAVLGYVNVAALRQHLRAGERVHGIFTEAGTAANVVPATARAHWYVRSPRRKGLDRLKERVVACLQAGADASGCAMDLEWIDPAYDDMVDNRPLMDRYMANAARLGREVIDPGQSEEVVGSTDMGNVSYAVPSIHPMIKVAPSGVAIHTEDFAGWAASEDGDRGVLDGAKALAMTVADVWLDPELGEQARKDFEQGVAEHRR